MILEFVVFFIGINLLFEFIQTIFPMSKMFGYIKSFVSIMLIYVICLKVGKLI